MKALLLLLIPGLLVVFGFWVGSRISRGNHLSTAERKELQALRILRESLTEQAPDHVLLGDNFAPIVRDEIRTSRKATER
jgi:hypothetical protein